MKRLAIILAGIFAAATLGTSTAAHASAAAVSAPAHFTTSGRHIRVAGQNWTPYGVTVSGLEHPGKPELRHISTQPSWRDFAAADIAQINAAATYWHSNVVRLQVDINTMDGSYPAFRTQLALEVSTAEADGMAVVINAQGEWDAANTSAPDPQTPQVTVATYTFWEDVAAIYASDPHVIFDLLNEPAGLTGAQWNTAFQPLVNYVRGFAPSTQLWVEGPQGSSRLNTIEGNYLTGGNIVYEIHHPWGANVTAGTPLATAEAAWEGDYGNLLATGHAVVDGEWSNWAAQRGECWPEAATEVPAYLSWLQGQGIGMTVWALGWTGTDSPGSSENMPNQGVGYTGPAVLADQSDPTYATASTIGSDYACDGSVLGESAGSLIQTWFGQESGR